MSKRLPWPPGERLHACVQTVAHGCLWEVGEHVRMWDGSCLGMLWGGGGLRAEVRGLSRKVGDGAGCAELSARQWMRGSTVGATGLARR